jgi:hypothetical protein
MTDPDTLALAYFRAEFQISPQQASLLWGLWTARTPLSPADLAERLSMNIDCLKVAMHGLRKALEPRSIEIEPPAAVASAGRLREIRFYLAPHARAEIDRLLVSAATGLTERLRPKVEPFNDVLEIAGRRKWA